MRASRAQRGVLVRAQRGACTASWLAAIVVLAACGGAPRSSDPEREPVARDSRTPLEQRRDTACEQLGPRITACAVEDARAALAAGKVERAQFERDTAPGVQQRNTEEFVRACKRVSSSRQVRVLEVCPRAESQCAPLLDCLGHLSDK